MPLFVMIWYTVSKGDIVQINRLFEIVYLLMDKKSMTANELAAHFEVSRRTILRDIDTLTTAGIPIYTSRGKGGGISISDRFVFNKTVISESEQRQILFALQGMAATALIETDGILSRLRSLFNHTDKNWIEVDFSRWGNSEADRSKFDVLKNAVINERTLSFIYSGSSGETARRKVYPLKLVFKSQSWYVQAFCLLRNEYRTFKISRMRNLDVTADVFDGRAFHAPDMEQAESQVPCLTGVKLRFAPHAAFRAYDEFDERDIVRNEDGSLTAAIYMPDDNWFYNYVFSFGDSLEVMEPQWVRDEVVRRAEKIKRKYLNKT